MSVGPSLERAEGDLGGVLSLLLLPSSQSFRRPEREEQKTDGGERITTSLKVSCTPLTTQVADDLVAILK